MTRTTTFLALAFGGILACSALSASAHEMFLKPNAYHLSPNTKTEIALFNGTFEKSENPITRDRMKAVSVMTGGQIASSSPTQRRDDATTSYLDLTVGAPGTYAVGVSTAPRIIELSADNFEEYLMHDGIEDTLKARRAEKAPRTPVRERYSKHVKTIVQAGATQSDDYARPLGSPAEILLAQNPAAVKVGDTMGFKALIRGQPLADQLVYASYAGFPGQDGAKAIRMRTDATGAGAFKITRPGIWFDPDQHAEGHGRGRLRVQATGRR